MVAGGLDAAQAQQDCGPVHDRAGGRRIAHHTPLLKIPVWWRRVPSSERKKERKREVREGRTARRHHTGILRRGVWCASRRPPLGVRLFYLSSQSLADSCCDLHATSRSSPSRRALVLSLVASSSVASLSSAAAAPPPPPAGPLFSRLLSPFGAAPPSSQHILAPRVYRALLEQGRVF